MNKRNARAARLLRDARALIEVPERWTQRAFARDRDGEESGDVNIPDAVCWCADGALLKVSLLDLGSSHRGSPDYQRASDFLLVASHRFGDGVWEVNDTTDHATVLRMFDLAIATAEGAGK